MFKRILPVVLVIAVLISMLCFPVHAAESEYICQNLLEVPNFYYRTVVRPDWTFIESTFINFTGRYYYVEYGIWLNERDLQYDFTYLDLYCARTPDRVKIQYAPGLPFVSGEFVGSYDSVQQYKIPCKQRVTDVVIRIEFDDTYTGVLGLYSFLGFLEIGSPVTKVNVYASDVLLKTDNTVETHEYPASTMTVPGSKLYTANYANAVGELHFTGVQLDIPEDYREFNNIKQLSCVIACPDSFGAALHIYRAGRVISVIDPVISYGWSIDDVPTNEIVTNQWSLLYTEFVFDLSNLDLDDCTLSISFTMDAHTADSSSMDKFTYFHLLSCNISPQISEISWYQVFWNWLRGGLNNLATTITNSIDNAVSVCTNIFNTVSSGFNRISSIVGQFSNDVGRWIDGLRIDITDHIDGAGENITSAIGDSSDQISGAVDDSSDQISSSVVGSGDKIAGAVDDSSDQITGAVDDSSDQISGAVNDGSDQVSDAVTDGTDKISDDITNGGSYKTDITTGSSDTSSLIDGIQDLEDDLKGLYRPGIGDIDDLYKPWMRYDNNALVLMRAITNNVRIQNIMLIIVSFSLCGFILFGKRG